MSFCVYCCGCGMAMAYATGRARRAVMKGARLILKPSPASSRGAGPRMRIVRIIKSILLNEEKLSPKKYGCSAFLWTFFPSALCGCRVPIRRASNLKNEFRIIKCPQFTVYFYGLSVFPSIYHK